MRSRPSTRKLGVLTNPQASADAIVEAAIAPPKKKNPPKQPQPNTKPRKPLRIM